MATLKELSKRESAMTAGHRMCPGCTAPIIVKLVTMATTKPLVISCATGCLEVSSTIYPYSAWNCSFIHNAFENSAATMSGVEAAYNALRRRGKLKDEFKFIAFGGDGGTYDIGLQSLSGAMERAHDMLYVCYDNGAYMNCLSTDSMIMTENGLKKITEVKEGDNVYAFDQKTHQLVLKECSGVFDNGVQDVYELSTLHHSIKATSNHPFLIFEKNSNKEMGPVIRQTKNNILVWKTLEKIMVGDEVVAFKDLQKEFEYEEVINIRYIGKETTLDLRVEGEHNFIADGIVVHNTGVQRSSATPRGANTTTSPVGKVETGKKEYRKNLTEIMVAHRIPYIAQASPSHWNDLVRKTEKALSIKGPKFMNTIMPCTLGWVFPPEQGIEIAKLAVETCFWPLYEVENGKYTINYKPKEIKPLTEFINTQSRFSHLKKEENKHIVEELQADVKKEWEDLLKKEELTKQ